MNSNEIVVGKISEELEKLIGEKLCKCVVGQDMFEVIPMEDLIKNINPMGIIEKYHLNKTINGVWIGSNTHNIHNGEYIQQMKEYMLNIKSIDPELYDMLVKHFIFGRKMIPVNSPIDHNYIVMRTIYEINTNINSPEKDLRLLALAVKDIRDLADMVDGVIFTAKSMVSGDQNQLYKELEDNNKAMLKRNREWDDEPRGGRYQRGSRHLRSEFMCGND